ncbi:hypothetical protein BH20ACT20_BH20ACT20_09480 [soil metagenome]|jgi:TolA-binding protein
MASMDEDPLDESRRFMRELILRFERSFQEVSRSIASNTRAVEQVEIRLRNFNREMEERHLELRAEYQAQRGTLLAILDRLDRLNGNGGTAPA